jgi:hypothetical protein
MGDDAFARRKRSLAGLPAIVWVCFAYAQSDPASAADPYDDAATPEGWAYSQIMAGERADFDKHCGTEFPLDDARWGGNCRTVSSRFVTDLLTRAPMREAVPFEGVRFNGVHIVGDIDLQGAKLIRPVEFANSRIDGAITLDYAHTDGFLSLTGSRIKGDFNGLRLHSQSDLLLGEGVVFSGNLTLKAASIDGDVEMSGSRFEGIVNAESIKTRGNVLVRDADCARALDMTFAQVARDLDLRGATLAGLDLSGASIEGELRLGGSHKSVDWHSKGGTLNLRNAHIGRLMDAKDAWPAIGRLRLDGFTFDHLGGHEGDTMSQMAARGADWWDKWARLDPEYSAGPYVQLAAAFKKLGDSDAADEIRYLGRVRESEDLSGLAFLWSELLRDVAGFGIGRFIFRTLFWAFLLSFLGAIVLRTTVKGVRQEGHQWTWCFGASLSHLLPIIELNKDFTAFFEDSRHNCFTPWQAFFFTLVGINGWLLAMMIAIASGIGTSEVFDLIKLLIRA